jgi:Ni/Co efflux regulator RcnB
MKQMKRYWTTIVLAMVMALPMMLSLGGCLVEDRGHDHWDHRDWDHHDHDEDHHDDHR